MKITELQIGDWIHIEDESWGVNRNARVREIEKNDEDYGVIVSERGLAFFDDTVTPIPLTEEILEKNGWKDKWWWDLPECPFSLVKYCENSWADGKWGVMFNSEDNSPSFLIGGIHELQHLLRLCELNDLADNFQI